MMMLLDMHYLCTAHVPTLHVEQHHHPITHFKHSSTRHLLKCGGAMDASDNTKAALLVTAGVIDACR